MNFETLPKSRDGFWRAKIIKGIKKIRKIKEQGLKWKTKHIRNCNWRIKLKKKTYIKRNKDGIRNSMNEDWNWKITNKKDNYKL